MNIEMNTTKKYLLTAAVVLAAMIPSASTAQKAVPAKLHMFGFAASFNDTIVHFTDIQTIDSAWINAKNKFLLARDQYSAELRNYLTEHQMPYRTCIVIYDKKLDKLQKKFLKMKKLYMGDKKVKTNNLIKTIGADEFRFTPINMSQNNYTEEETEEEETPKATKKSKKDKK